MVKLVILYFLLSGAPAVYVGAPGSLAVCERGRSFIAGACVPVENIKSPPKKKKPPIKYKHSYAPINPEWKKWKRSNVQTTIF